MAPRYGDDAIARVLNKLGRRTGKGKPWSPFAPQKIPRADLNQPRMRVRGARPLDAHRTSRAGDTSDTQAQLFL